MLCKLWTRKAKLEHRDLVFTFTQNFLDLFGSVTSCDDVQKSFFYFILAVFGRCEEARQPKGNPCGDEENMRRNSKQTVKFGLNQEP